MQQPLPFDPDIYYGIVAENLFKNFGARALSVADMALNKMRALGDKEGLGIWLAIHEHLATRAAEVMREDLTGNSPTLH
ncbi:hypothetical protein [Eilatimonas milleporae]|uniref:Uncharacterized protein n=1 Tax=Eilatimonas milleporae TaxID=911205 RepID=A0A3M0C6R4_9PROT|nr:hypothetical protein [Eilatimonas milleporae]RMB02769.1 hypothetical protein BXY39_3121 [Eilatimonas milleporae]